MGYEMNRRLFLASTSAGAFSLLTPLTWGVAEVTMPKKILVLGGTNFLDPAIVEQALGAGCEVTLFNRGITLRAPVTRFRSESRLYVA